MRSFEVLGSQFFTVLLVSLGTGCPTSAELGGKPDDSGAVDDTSAAATGSETGDDPGATDSGTTGSSTTDSTTSAATDGLDSDSDGSIDDEGRFDDADEGSGGPQPDWQCTGVGLLGSGSLVWAEPSDITGVVTSLSVDGEPVDTAIDTMWTGQFEHWGPCLTVDNGYVGVVLAMGPEVMGDAESQIRVAVDGGAGTYALESTIEGTVEDPTVYVGCSTIVDGAYFGGPSIVEGMPTAATGSLELVSVPDVDGEVLHLVLSGSNGDGFCEYELDVQLTVPDGYFAAAEAD